MMNGAYKQCPKGHYYQGESCPYCKTRNEKMGVESGAGTIETEIFVGTDNRTDDSTVVDENTGGNHRSGATRTVFGNEQDLASPTFASPSGGASSRTVFGDGNGMLIGDPDEIGTRFDPPAGNKGVHAVNNSYRTERKLVGWLVSYTLDAMGVDFKLYEGRNVIGRDADCNITIQDPMMSAKHAVLLFRANKYSLTDTQSSHGTFVNDTDIELEPCYLNDGDIIRMGKTIFKFRTSF